MTQNSTATATATNGHYTITADAQTIEHDGRIIEVDAHVIEFNSKRRFAYVVLGRSFSPANSETEAQHWAQWRLWSKTNQLSGAEQKWTAWGAEAAGEQGSAEVLVVPVAHQD